MIELFSDCKHDFYSEGDVRLQALLATLHFFKEWSAQVTSANQFISAKLWFISVVQTKLRRFPGSTVKPAIINQDAVENHFSQIRAANGQNDNTTYLATQGTQNSIIFGQTTVSRKSNTGTAKVHSFAGLPKENLFGSKGKLQQPKSKITLLK